MTSPVLSILIPTLESRRDSFTALTRALAAQITAIDADRDVEILSDCDSGEKTIGAKRNGLLDRARGDFVVFVDDDDEVSSQYVAHILDAIREKPEADCVVFPGKIIFSDGPQRIMRHSISFKEWKQEGGDYVRPPCHISPIKREIATRFRFEEVDYAEDVHWTLRMSLAGALEQEATVNETLYFYRTRTSYSYQRLVDISQPLRHALGLTSANKLRIKKALQDHRKLVAGTAMFLVAMLVFLSYLASGGRIADHDALIMGDVARRVAEGQDLYLEAWDNKPPLALLYYLPAHLVAPGSYTGQQLLTFLWTLLQGVMAIVILRRESLWLRSAVFALLLLLPVSRVDFIWGSSEDVTNLFAVFICLVGFQLVRHREVGKGTFLALGLAGAFVFHVRQPGILFLAFPLAAAATQPGARRPRFLLFLVGSLVGGAVIATTVISMSSLDAYLDVMFRMPSRYVASDLWSIRMAALEHCGRMSGNVIFVLPLLAIFLLRTWQERILMSIALAAALLVVVSPIRGFGHYEQQMIPAFLVGFLLLAKTFEARHAGQFRLASMAFLIVLALGGLGATESVREDFGEMQSMEDVASFVDQNATEDATLYAAGVNSAYVYFRCQTRPCHKLHWDQHLKGLATRLRLDAARIADEIVEEPPTWLVLDAKSRKRFDGDPDMQPVTELDRLLGKLSALDYIEKKVIGKWTILQCRRSR